MAKTGFEKYRVLPKQRGYGIDRVEGAQCPWRVFFLVDGVEVGGGQYQTREAAEDAGADFMFSGDLQ
jgi:hypothetical protein